MAFYVIAQIHFEIGLVKIKLKSGGERSFRGESVFIFNGTMQKISSMTK